MHNHLDVNLASLEHLDAQRARSWRSLVASVPPESVESQFQALLAGIGEVREERAFLDLVVEETPEFRQAYKRAVEHTIESLTDRQRSQLPLRPSRRVSAMFGRNLRDELSSLLFGHLSGATAPTLAARGLPLPGEEALDQMARAATREILETSKVTDLYDTVQRSLRTEGAGGNYTLERLLSDPHVEQVTKSLAATSRDAFERRVLTYGMQLSPNNPAGLTGKTKWTTSGKPDSRHAELNGMTNTERGGTFNFKGKRISGPRDNPADTKQWSNCRCSLLYLRNDGTWA